MSNSSEYHTGYSLPSASTSRPSDDSSLLVASQATKKGRVTTNPGRALVAKAIDLVEISSSSGDDMRRKQEERKRQSRKTIPQSRDVRRKTPVPPTAVSVSSNEDFHSLTATSPPPGVELLNEIEIPSSDSDDQIGIPTSVEVSIEYEDETTGANALELVNMSLFNPHHPIYTLPRGSTATLNETPDEQMDRMILEAERANASPVNARVTAG